MAASAISASANGASQSQLKAVDATFDRFCDDLL